MKHSTKPPNKAERMRFAAIREVGCLPCWMNGVSFNPCTIQHVVKGRKRLGHQFTYGSCPWHHLGHPLEGLDDRQSEQEAGPSLAKNPRAFHKRFGTEDQLVALCDEMIAPYIREWMSTHT